jgi:putative transposase
VQIERVRIVHRADGSSIQFGVEAQRQIVHQPSGRQVGIDMGLLSYYTDSLGHTVDNPRYSRKAEQKLKRLHRRLSRKHKQSQHRKKARKALAKGYLKVGRQREDFARKQADALVSSHDLIAYEHLQIRNLVKNRHLAKSLHDAGWGTFLRWVRHYGVVPGIPIIAVEPQFTSQDRSACGTRVKKSLSVRTHLCPGCGVVLDRDHKAALCLLQKALAMYPGAQGNILFFGGGNAWGEPTSTAVSAMATQQAGSRNQEPTVL